MLTTLELLDSEYFEIIVDFISRTTSKNDAQEFVLSVLTPTEAVRIGQRIVIVSLLESGYTHRKIVEILRVSFTTVARASRQLQDGRFAFNQHTYSNQINDML